MDKTYYKKYEPVYTPIAKIEKRKNPPSCGKSGGFSDIMSGFDESDFIILALIFILFMEENRDYIMILALLFLLLS